jgi:hypothetical protein
VGILSEIPRGVLTKIGRMGYDVFRGHAGIGAVGRIGIALRVCASEAKPLHPPAIQERLGALSPTADDAVPSGGRAAPIPDLLPSRHGTDALPPGRPENAAVGGERCAGLVESRPGRAA